MCKKQQIYEIHQKKLGTKKAVVHPVNEALDAMELFRTFKKYDRNMNGSLDFSEYTKCLNESPNIDLSKQEIITVAMAADINGDGVIDFEEFMKHFSDILNMIQFQKELKETFDESQDLKGNKMGKMEELGNVGSLAQQEMAKVNAGTGNTFAAMQSTTGTIA
jgi:hypothetical protein